MASSPAQWPPLLAEALGEIESADSLVTWGVDAWGDRRVVGLRELRVAALLFACSQQQEGPSASPDWAGLLDFAYEDGFQRGGIGRASLLDLAVRFGHADVARCLHQRGQRQARALGPYDLQRVPTKSLATLPLRDEYFGVDIWFGEWRRNEENGAWEQERWMREDGRWQHTDALAEPLCPWGHWAQGHWASDWNAATHCARMLVDAPATRAALALVAEGVPLDLEEGAAVRLLDAALLLGEPGAAAALADRCGSRRPVRLWPCDRGPSCWYPMTLESLEAHLRVGHRDLWALGFAHPALVAAKAVKAGSRSLAQALSGLLGRDEPPAPLQLYGLALLRQHGAGTAVVEPAALDALEALGSPPPACRVQMCYEFGETILVEVSLLLFSCALGDKRAARRLVRMGSTFTGLDAADTRPAGLLSDPGSWLPEYLQINFDVAPAARRLEVAEGSLRKLFVAAARHSCCTIAATRRCSLLGRPELLGHVVGFAMSWSDAEEGMRQEVQRLIGYDPLGDLAVAPCALWSRTVPSPATVATAIQAALLPPPGQLPSEQLSDVPGGHAAEQFLESPAGTSGAPATELHGTASTERLARSGAELGHTAAGTEGQADEKDMAMESEELGQVLEQSGAEALQADTRRAMELSEEAALNEPTFDGPVYALRRFNQHSREMVEALLASEALRPCCEQVADAGCELQPAWAGGALLLVPMTRKLYLELGLKLSAHHVFCLKGDVGRLQTAVGALPRSIRPKLRPDHRAARYIADPRTANLVREYGCGVRNTFLADEDELLAVPALRRTKSAPADMFRQGEEAP